MLKKAHDVLQKKKKAQGMIQMANESLPGVFPKLKPSPRMVISVETEPKEEEEKKKTGSPETLKCRGCGCCFACGNGGVRMDPGYKDRGNGICWACVIRKKRKRRRSIKCGPKRCSIYCRRKRTCSIRWRRTRRIRTLNSEARKRNMKMGQRVTTKLRRRNWNIGKSPMPPWKKVRTCHETEAGVR